MPEAVREVLLTETPDFLPQFIHSGLFIGVFRYLAPLCATQLGVPETDFWQLVRAEIVRHQTRFPHLKERYELFDLFAPEIERLCLNRNRLHLDGYRDRAARPHAAVHGTVPNPLHAEPPRPSHRNEQGRAPGRTRGRAAERDGAVGGAP